ncbi:GTP-binding protein [Martelella sp. HB161492]|uniref:GTP-binding protein n=1 Tax=Martelella sp. HB161492 TaxID=2720726 RepID=UPI001590D8DB
MTSPIPVSIITGFLGAGKSTLLNRLLTDPALSDAAIIINEFGEIGIDHLLVEQSGENIVELSNGCLCCSVRGELINTLADLLDRMQTEKIRPISRVVIETTGLADPVPVLKAVIAHPAIAAAFAIDGVITLADAQNGLATLENHEEAVRQAMVADRLIITKTDLAASEKTLALRQRLAALNPNAELLDNAELSNPQAALLAAGLFDAARRQPEVGQWLSEADAAHHHHHHDVNRHGDHIRSFALNCERPIARADLMAFFDMLAARHGPSILRMKGVVALEGEALPVAIHGVQEIIYPPVRLKAWPPGEKPTSRLVLITADLKEDVVRDLFDAFLGRPVIDRPDRTALTENPLSAFGFKPG